ncbi:MAG TPA: glycosyltransferase [Solirubrobacterales bacterium]|nr:glycosyltransferase [Solirubrobacterales bacterium]
MRLRGKDIVCIGSADWQTELPVNQHHLMGLLARENRVLFVESLGLRRPQIAGRDLRRIWRRLLTGLHGVREIDGVSVLSPLVLPFHGHESVRRLNRRLLRLQVTRAARKLGMDAPVLWAYVPQAEALVGPLRPSLVVYHCVDDVAAQKGVDAEGFRAAERRFAARADLVLASAPTLDQRMRTLSDHVLYAPNVADTDLFATALEGTRPDRAVAALPRPRIIFHGAIVATKLDLGLLAALAASRPDWSIALIGPRGAGDPGTDLAPLEHASNIHLLGSRKTAELPAVLAAGDVGLIPYAVNELTRSVFPMKVYEYLAAGLPVIATPLPALAGVEGVDIVVDAGAAVAAIERELAGDTPQRRKARSERALGHSWQSRIAEIEAALPEPPRRGV